MKPTLHRHVILPTVLIGAFIAGHLCLYLSLIPNFHRARIFPHLHARLEPGGLLAAFGVLAAGLLAARFLTTESVDRGLAWVEHRARWIAVAYGVVLVAGSLTAYHAHTLSMDEYAAVYQARLFAEGQIWAQYEPEMIDRLVPRWFQRHFFGCDLENGRVISSYWPGFSLLLTPFVALGAPWLLNPLLSVCILLLLRHLAQALFPGTRAGAWALLFALASPQLMAYGISFYAMNAHLILNLVFVALLLQPTATKALAAGAVGSLALALHQPVPHTLFALPWIVWIALRKDRLKLLPALAMGYLPLTVLLGFGWGGLAASFRATSDATVSAPVTTLPFGNDIPGLQSLASGINRGLATFGMPKFSLLFDRLLETEKLVLWAMPGLPVLAFWGWRKYRDRLPFKLLAASVLVTLVGYLFVPFNQGHGWGFRYFHQAWAVLPLFAGAFMVSEGGQQKIRRTFFAMTVLAMAVLTPLRLYQIEDFIEEQISQLPPLSEDASFQIRFINIQRPYYREDLVQNDPLLRSPVLNLISHGRDVDEEYVRSRFPNARLTFDDGVDSVWRFD